VLLSLPPLSGLPPPPTERLLNFANLCRDPPATQALNYIAGQGASLGPLDMTPRSHLAGTGPLRLQRGRNPVFPREHLP